MTNNTQANQATNRQKGHILWLEYNDATWADSYRRVMPETSSMLLVQDTTEAKLAFDCYDDIHTAVLQLNSYKSFGSEPEMYDFGPVPTSMLVQWLEQRNFRGRVYVISSMGLTNATAYFKRCAPEVICMDRAEFLAQASSLLQENYVRPSALEIAQKLLTDMSASGLGDEWLDGPRNMIKDWEGFQRTITQGAEAAYSHFAQLDIVCSLGIFKKKCSCGEEPSEERALWRHEYHGLYNRGIWEIIQNTQDARKMLHEQLELDIASPDDYVGEMGPFGEYLLKERATTLRDFLSADITPHNWFMAWPKG